MKNLGILRAQVAWPENLYLSILDWHKLCCHLDGSEFVFDPTGVDLALNNLTDFERDIIKLYFQEKKSLRAIGVLYNKSQERIRQVLRKAVRKLCLKKNFQLFTAVKRVEYESVLNNLDVAQKRIVELEGELNELKENYPVELLKEIQGVKELSQVNIFDCEFSVRLYNCLNRANIKTIGDLLKLNRQQILHIRNLGSRTMLELEEFMEKKYSYKLGENLTDKFEKIQEIR